MIGIGDFINRYRERLRRLLNSSEIVIVRRDTSGHGDYVESRAFYSIDGAIQYLEDLKDE